MNTNELFLLAMLMIFSIPWLLWRLVRSDDIAPLVVVQILAGVLLGPGMLGEWFPAYYEFVFTPPVIQMLTGIAMWAVMIFVMLAGIELDLRKAWADRRNSGLTAGFALGIPTIAGAIAAVFLWRDGGWAGPQAQSWQFVMGVGISCAVTALPILILLMEKLDILRLDLGQRVLRYASLDDVAIWGVLAVILTDWARLGKQAIFAVAFVALAWVFRRVMEKLTEPDRWFLSLVWLALCGLGSDWAGLHYMVGAFLAGVVIDAHWFNQQRLDLLRHHVLLVVMPVYFLSTGLRTDWSAGGWPVLGAAVLLLVVSVVSKLIGVGVASRLLGWARGDWWVVGWLLQTKALIMIIFANILLDKHIIAAPTFTALLLMAVLSTMLTVPMVKGKLK